MPNLNDILKNRDQKKFVKKSYRPWDLTGENLPNQQVKQDDKKSTENILSSNNIINIKDTSIINDLLGNNQVTIREQLDIYPVTIEEQINNNQITNKKQIENTKETDQVTIREQLGNSLDPTDLYNRVINLSGLQRSILEFVADFCTINDSFETGPIETTTIALHIKTSIGSVKTSINRLIEKNLLIRKKGRTAKGGYINLSTYQNVLEVITEQRRKFHRKENSSDIIMSIRQQLDNNLSYISSSNFTKNTTTEKKETIPREWEKIDYEVLSNIGFTKNHIKQLINKTEPEIVQESINHFAFGLQYNSKIKQYENPINVLMGVLRKGQAWFEKDYRSQKEIAQEKLIESKKAEMERRKKLEEETYKLAFAEWQDQLTDNEKDKIAPNKKDLNDITPRTVKLSTYFREHIWIDKKKEYLVF